MTTTSPDGTRTATYAIFVRRSHRTKYEFTMKLILDRDGSLDKEQANSMITMVRVLKDWLNDPCVIHIDDESREIRLEF